MKFFLQCSHCKKKLEAEVKDGLIVNAAILFVEFCDVCAHRIAENAVKEFFLSKGVEDELGDILPQDVQDVLSANIELKKSRSY